MYQAGCLDRRALAGGGAGPDRAPVYTLGGYYTALAADAAADTSPRRYYRDHRPAMAAMAVVARAESIGTDRRAEEEAQGRLLRDIFGNPFRPVAVGPAWLTADVVGLAGTIYDARAFHDLPVLADALQDAGCDNAAVLDHCRGPGPHTRGCWAIDMLTGRV